MFFCFFKYMWWSPFSALYLSPSIYTEGRTLFSFTPTLLFIGKKDSHEWLRWKENYSVNMCGLELKKNLNKKKDSSRTFLNVCTILLSNRELILFAIQLLSEHIFHSFLSLSPLPPHSSSLSASDCFSYASFICFSHNFALHIASHGLFGHLPCIQLQILLLTACLCWVTLRRQKPHWLY